jgi:hypothetical protein
MPATYEPIQTYTLGSAQATITFSSIPSTYTDLRLVMTGTVTASAGSAFAMRFNSDTATNYSYVAFYGNGGSVQGYDNATNINAIIMTANFRTTIPVLATFDIMSYAASRFKTSLITYSYDDGAAGGLVTREAALWRSTSAINRIDITTTSTTYAAGTTATLYGIKNA